MNIDIFSHEGQGMARISLVPRSTHPGFVSCSTGGGGGGEAWTDYSCAMPLSHLHKE